MKKLLLFIAIFCNLTSLHLNAMNTNHKKVTKAPYPKQTIRPGIVEKELRSVLQETEISSNHSDEDFMQLVARVTKSVTEAKEQLHQATDGSVTVESIHVKIVKTEEGDEGNLPNKPEIILQPANIDAALLNTCLSPVTKGRRRKLCQCPWGSQEKAIVLFSTCAFAGITFFVFFIVFALKGVAHQ